MSLVNGVKWLELYKNRDKSLDLIECPKCHNKYHWNVVANEPFRVITDDDGKNKKKVCEDCYFEWVGSDPEKMFARYSTRMEETDEGIVHVKDLTEITDEGR